jgi:hypothetical protein
LGCSEASAEKYFNLTKGTEAKHKTIAVVCANAALAIATVEKRTILGEHLNMQRKA